MSTAHNDIIDEGWRGMEGWEGVADELFVRNLGCS
jgi:hypothetical protein